MIEVVAEMARAGLGRDRARFRLTDVQALDAAPAGAGQVGLRPLSDLIGARVAQLMPLDRACVRFEFPTRIRVKGDLQTEVTFGLLVRNVLRRLAFLSDVHGEGRLAREVRPILAAAESVQTESRRLRWLGWGRWSNRQQQFLRVGGFFGRSRLSWG